jgi:iron complex outermembrane receptor protein
MNKRRLEIVTIALLLVCSMPVFAQTNKTVNSDSLLDLQEIVIYSKAKDSTNAIGAKRMEVFNRTDVSHALNVLPGVTLTNVGARNESTVFVRGFDSRQVPIFIDGVEVK